MQVDGSSVRYRTDGAPPHRRTRLLAVLLAMAVAASVALVSPPPHAAAADVDAGTGERLAVLIGINDYAGRTVDTYGSVGDVRDMRAVLVRAGWPEANIVELTDAHATSASIRDALRWLADRSTSQSMSVVHYSGHVRRIGGVEHLWSHDNRHLSRTELARSVHAVEGRVWVDIAGCHAGGFDDGLSSPRHLFTASSRKPEKSYEHPEWGTTVFGGLLIDRGLLRRAAAADEDGRISIQSAFAYAAERAPQVTAHQSHGPQHPVMAGGDGTAWYLDPPPVAEDRRFCLAGHCLG